LNEEYTMSKFLSLTNKIDPFNGYLNFMFKEKTSSTVGASMDYNDKVLPYDLLR
jgi:hypothetical protein